MNLSAEEKLMYAVMNAIYSSGIPIDFKGAMVLKACLMEAGFSDEIRHTADIDANWYSDSPPSAEQLIESLETALQKYGINLRVELYRMYGEGRSAGFELTDPITEEILFTMDMDVNRPVQPTRIYEVAGLRFRGVSPDQMLADKISVISTGKVFRRIKDIAKERPLHTKGALLSTQNLKLKKRRDADDTGILYGRFEKILIPGKKQICSCI